jgi:hypothetical protein
MRREQFLKVLGMGSLAAIAGSLASACKSTPTTPSDSEKIFTSNLVGGHNHTITIKKTEVESPPSGGISRDTTLNGHLHTFAMSAADLTNVRGGASVNIDTSETNGHIHTFSIQKWY